MSVPLWHENVQTREPLASDAFVACTRAAHSVPLRARLGDLLPLRGPPPAPEPPADRSMTAAMRAREALERALAQQRDAERARLAGDAAACGAALDAAMQRLGLAVADRDAASARTLTFCVAVRDAALAVGWPRGQRLQAQLRVGDVLVLPPNVDWHSDGDRNDVVVRRCTLTSTIPRKLVHVGRGVFVKGERVADEQSGRGCERFNGRTSTHSKTENTKALLDLSAENVELQHQGRLRTYSSPTSFGEEGLCSYCLSFCEQQRAASVHGAQCPNVCAFCRSAQHESEDCPERERARLIAGGTSDFFVLGGQSSVGNIF